MASTQDLNPAPVAAEPSTAPAADAPIDMDNLPAGVDPIAAQIAMNMSPEELAELQAEFGTPAPQAPAPESAPVLADPVADLTRQAQAPVPSQAPATDPVLVQTLQAIQQLVAQQAQENAALRAAMAPKRDPRAELAAKLPEKYRGDPQLIDFIDTLTQVIPQGNPNEVAALRQELNAFKQHNFAVDFANRNARAVDQTLVNGVLGGKARDIRLPDGTSLADELRELNFTVGAVYKTEPEKAAARTAQIVEAIGKAYVASKAAATQATAQAIRSAPKAVPAATPAQQTPKDDLTLTAGDVSAARGDPVRAIFNKAFGRRR